MEKSTFGMGRMEKSTSSFWCSAPNPICPGDSGGRAGFLTKPYKREKVQILESELVLTYLCKAVSQLIDIVPGPFPFAEIDFVPGSFRFQIELGHLDFAVVSG